VNKYNDCACCAKKRRNVGWWTSPGVPKKHYEEAAAGGHSKFKNVININVIIKIILSEKTVK